MSQKLIKPKRTYFNLDMLNNGATHVPAEINYNTTGNFIEDASKYRVFVERAEFPMDVVPIMWLTTGQAVMTVTTASGDTTYDLFNYLPTETSGKIFNINVLVGAVNYMLSDALGGTVPTIAYKYNPGSHDFTALVNLETLKLINGSYDSSNVFTAPSTTIFFNEFLFQLFGVGYSTVDVSSVYGSTSNKKFQIKYSFYNTYNQYTTLQYTHDSVVNGTVTMISFSQTKSSIANFFTACQRLLIETDLPIVDEYSNPQVVGNVGTVVLSGNKIITDISIDPESLTSFDQVIYNPANIRYATIISRGSSISGMKFRFLYRGYDGLSYPVMMPLNSAVSLKICFEENFQELSN
ncbi:hypothetical protein 6 [Drosophila-associated adintovirus 3]|uniref:Uncharacterized protein n=1 Tax=Drosophila-associated adintovirus 3 TaxID=2744818 RepID=A0A7D4VFP5_9VIRU|nr:hypothetical protein 6 [Drosophila-associated adintovirus 3]